MSDLAPIRSSDVLSFSLRFRFASGGDGYIQGGEFGGGGGGMMMISQSSVVCAPSPHEIPLRPGSKSIPSSVQKIERWL